MEHELFWGPNSEISQSWEDMHNLYFSSYFDMVDAFPIDGWMLTRER
jgi:hypothetical protein